MYLFDFSFRLTSDKNGKSILGTVYLTVLIFFQFLYFSSCKPTEKNNTTLHFQRPAADQVMDQFRTVYWEKGRKKWVMNALRAYVYEKKQYTEVERVKVEVYEKSKVTARVNADSGWVQEDKQKIHLRGNVRSVSQKEQMVLYTDEAEYRNDLDLIVSSAAVRIEWPDKIVTGVGFEASTDLSRIVVLNNRTEILR